MSHSIIPISRCPIVIRPAAVGDLPFIDALQKMHSHQVGFLHHEALEGKLSAGHILVAEHDGQPRTQLGYVIAQDQYFKRDDVGIVYQLNVMPVRQRHLVGASLVKAVFERAAYGCRLFSCWCAQDIQANYFWEALGFVPLAFRAGSRGKQRIHIFWQRRIRENDSTTPLWFPFQTSSGQIREDRIVLPIPPGVHWRDAMPIVLPTAGVPGMEAPGGELKPLAIPDKRAARPERPAMPAAMKVAIVRSKSAHLKGLPPGKAAVITSGGIRYVDRADAEVEVAPQPVKPKRAPKPKLPRNEKLLATVRELRDRCLERLNSGTMVIESKYDVSRPLEAAPAVVRNLLEKAA